MITADRLAQAFAIGSAPATDEYRFGTISEVSADGSVYVRLSNDSTTRCSCLYEASEGDRVQVCIKANGQAVVLGSIGKDDSPKPLAPYVLYSNASGTSGTVTLSETAANFKIIEFYYAKLDSGSGGYNCQRVYEPNGKDVSFFQMNYVSSANVNQMVNSRVKISGTSITWGVSGWTTNISTTSGQVGAGSHENKQLIYYVIGYK